MADRSTFRKALAKTARSRGTSGVKTYEDEAGQSYQAGHSQRVARPSAGGPVLPKGNIVGNEEGQGNNMTRLRKAMNNPSRGPAGVGQKHTKLASRMMQRRDKKPIGKAGFVNLLKSMTK